MESRLKKGLGRGLSSLLGDSTNKIETNKVSIKDLTRNKLQFVLQQKDKNQHKIYFDKKIVTQHKQITL